MRRKAKTFDCVEMKNRIQAQRIAEYLDQKGDYAFFADFVKARSAESKWVREMREKLSLTRS